MGRRSWPVIAGAASCMVGLCLGAAVGCGGGHSARLASVGLPVVAARSVPVVASGALPVVAAGPAAPAVAAGPAAPAVAAGSAVPDVAAGSAVPPAEHSQAGAVTAAASAMTVIRGPLLLEPDRYLAALQAVAEPDVAGALMEAVKPELSTLALRTKGGAVLRSSPVSWRMVGYAGDEAAVSVCLLSLFGGGIDPHPTVIAELISVRLTWVMTRWLVSAVISGPAIGPPVDAVAGSAAISYGDLAGYKEFRVVPVI